MAQQCSLCNDEVDELYLLVKQTTLDLIRADHPEWIEADGGCKKCMDYYNALDGEVEVLTLRTNL
ncbi:Uncharacterised protein [BD1-7 clade bacterium]|uniref:Uncharacterized protein n=1 Tax=BD1-7 clade bacterium TaxID=2029982 RepID=A0A5S9Q544_9GAMM|nr:Uncharacterised protein [BD1-7 clade bacterium]CAA0110379.1 Uncharacterised protein [BD1-7 clade bacterium]CAA0112746.1 Uncharacterised protein [BD1-7 clade bacterium]